MSRPENVGGMRDWVTILRRGTDTVDAKGNATAAYAAVRTIRCNMRHQSDNEFIQSAGGQLSTLVYFKFRTQADLLADDRLVCRGLTYEIKERHQLDDFGMFERIRAVAVRAERGA